MVNAEFFPLRKMCVIYYDPLIHELRNSEKFLSIFIFFILKLRTMSKLGFLRNERVLIILFVLL